MSEFYVVRVATMFEEWVDKSGNWNNEAGDPFEKGYHLDYPTKQDALDEADRFTGSQILVFSTEKPYPLIDWLPKTTK